MRGVSLDIERGCFYTLLGPSGCGKTTTLRTSRGWNARIPGRIIVGDTVVCDPEAGIFVEPNDRNIGMVFQSYAIWPHMTVFNNVAFPLRHLRPKPKTDESAARVLAALAMVKFDGLNLGQRHTSAAGSNSGLHWRGRWYSSRKFSFSMSR